jgi:hypothetical protein
MGQELQDCCEETTAAVRAGGHQFHCASTCMHARQPSGGDSSTLQEAAHGPWAGQHTAHHTSAGKDTAEITTACPCATLSYDTTAAEDNDATPTVQPPAAAVLLGACSCMPDAGCCSRCAGSLCCTPAARSTLGQPAPVMAAGTHLLAGQSQSAGAWQERTRR